MSFRVASRPLARIFVPVVVGLMAWLSVPAVAEEVPAEVLAQSRIHFERGSIFHAAGDYARAVVEYRAAFALYPSPELLFNLGQVARLSGDRKAALEYYRRYLSAEPDGRASEEARKYIERLDAQPADPSHGDPSHGRRAQLILSRPPAPAVPATGQMELGTRPETSRRPTRKRWVWGLIGGVGAAVVGGVVVGAVMGTVDRPPRPDVVLR